MYHKLLYTAKVTQRGSRILSSNTLVSRSDKIKLNQKVRTILPKTRNQGPTPPLTIGVLSLQRVFDAHLRRLEELGAKSVLVKNPAPLDDTYRLVSPGAACGT